MKNRSWVRNAIDTFGLAKLEEQALKPSAEAGSETLFRRLHLDLLGLPPAPETVARYLADTKPDRYERLVEELLQSPHFGEKWARH